MAIKQRTSQQKKKIKKKKKRGQLTASKRPQAASNKQAKTATNRPRIRQPDIFNKPIKPKRKPGRPFKDRATFKTFAGLQKHWYDKLKAEGFDDIEWTDHKSGIGQNSDYLKRADQQRIQHVKPNTYEYFRLCTNYFTNCTRWKSNYHRTSWKLYCEGATYRQILDFCNAKYKQKRTLFYMHYIIKQLEAKCMVWNERSKYGMLNPAEQDFVVDDIPIKALGARNAD